MVLQQINDIREREYGMIDLDFMEGLKDEEYPLFLRRLNERFNIDLSGYKPRVKRRIGILMKKYKISSYLEYLRLIEKNEQKRVEFLNKLTINVSEFFRNADRWKLLKNKYLSLLYDRFGKELKIWSAGCAYGQESYSLAILLEELHLPSSIKVLATDIDDNALNRGKEGIYEYRSIFNLSSDLLEKYFIHLEDSRHYKVKQRLKSRVEFKHHNLLTDPFDENFSLILCRNVVIYFTKEVKNILYYRFSEALSKGGILLTGGTERIFNYKELGLKSIEPFFYEKE